MAHCLISFASLWFLALVILLRFLILSYLSTNVSDSDSAPLVWGTPQYFPWTSLLYPVNNDRYVYVNIISLQASDIFVFTSFSANLSNGSQTLGPWAVSSIDLRISSSYMTPCLDSSLFSHSAILSGGMKVLCPCASLCTLWT